MDLVFYLGQAFERWNPVTLARDGAGGSEAMAWAVASRLAAGGHRVRVFADARGLAGTFAGVEWRDFSEYPGTCCDVLISSRRPEALDPAYGVRAARALFWAHDAHYGDELTRERAERYARFVVPSAWHAEFWRQRYPSTAQRVLIVPNGIDLALFPQDRARDPHRLIYSSAPDRGLDMALAALPKIRERVPDASLHVFYGFETLLRRAEHRQDLGLAAELRDLQRRLAAYARHGVIFHGRLGPAELAVEFSKSGVWGYPTAFWETSCITAMEAQAAGCLVVTTPIGALTETVGNRGTMVREPPGTPAYAAAYADAVVRLMTRGSDAERQALRAFARSHFDLEAVVARWAALLLQA